MRCPHAARPLVGLVAALAAIAVLPVQAAEMAEISYHVLKDAADKVVAMRASSKEKTDKIVAEIAITRKTPSTEPLHLWIDRPDGRVEIPIDADGIITLPSSPDLIADDPLVHSNASKGTLNLAISLNIVLPDPPFDYAAVASAAKQLDRVIKDQAPVSFLAPKVQSLQLFMAPGKADCMVRLSTGGGDVLIPGKDGMVAIKLSDALAATNPMITPTCPLLKHDIEVD